MLCWYCCPKRILGSNCNLPEAVDQVDIAYTAAIAAFVVGMSDVGFGTEVEVSKRYIPWVESCSPLKGEIR